METTRQRWKAGETAARWPHRPSSRPGQHHFLSLWLLQQEKRTQHPPCPQDHRWFCGSPHPDLAPWGQEETLQWWPLFGGRGLQQPACGPWEMGVHSCSVQAVTPSVTKRQVRVPITQRGHTIPKCQFGADKGLRMALQGEGVYALKSPNCPKALS